MKEKRKDFTYRAWTRNRARWHRKNSRFMSEPTRDSSGRAVAAKAERRLTWEECKNLANRESKGSLKIARS